MGLDLSAMTPTSGFVWRPGLIVTADEALSEEGEFAVILSGGHTVPAQLVGRDPSTDVALLRVDRSDLRPVPLEAAPVPVGALAIAIAAEDGAPTAALGVVSRSAGPWRSLRGGEIDARIELDLRLRRGAPWFRYTQQRPVTRNSALGGGTHGVAREGVVAGSASPSTPPSSTSPR
jgi:S1-C subfamily serine protease